MAILTNLGNSPHWQHTTLPAALLATVHFLPSVHAPSTTPPTFALISFCRESLHLSTHILGNALVQIHIEMQTPATLPDHQFGSVQRAVSVET